MTTHDVLAYAVATEVIAQIHTGTAPWGALFSPAAHVTSSRSWPIPDFVIRDATHAVTAAAEFKPPDQSKREYLTGLGQAIAYSRSFNYSFLVVPTIADDRYPIAEHIRLVLDQPEFVHLPVGILSYDPALISPTNGAFNLLRYFPPRGGVPSSPARVTESFYAKWREISPSELSVYLDHLYEEARKPTTALGTIRDRAFERLWNDLQAGRLEHWGGGVRTATNTPSNKEGWRKNYRNFVAHIGWIETDGRLTDQGMKALNLVFKYGAKSVSYVDFLARSVLISGKHLVLIRAIYDFQNKYTAENGPFPDEQSWLNLIEAHLEDRGLLKRNPGRSLVAVRMSARQFLKAEKQLWKNLGFVSPYGPTGRFVYHSGKGFLFNWSRISELLQE